jgi:hypothetical protein
MTALGAMTLSDVPNEMRTLRLVEARTLKCQKYYNIAHCLPYSSTTPITTPGTMCQCLGL